jgi:hypothetical protein
MSDQRVTFSTAKPSWPSTGGAYKSYTEGDTLRGFDCWVSCAVYCTQGIRCPSPSTGDPSLRACSRPSSSRCLVFRLPRSLSAMWAWPLMTGGSSIAQWRPMAWGVLSQARFLAASFMHGYATVRLTIKSRSVGRRGRSGAEPHRKTLASCSGPCCPGGPLPHRQASCINWPQRSWTRNRSSLVSRSGAGDRRRHHRP